MWVGFEYAAHSFLLRAEYLQMFGPERIASMLSSDEIGNAQFGSDALAFSLSRWAAL